MHLSLEEIYQMSYVQENGPKLLIGFGTGFSPQQVIHSQIGMLQANSIRGLVPFQAEVVDGQYRFRYDLSGLRKFEPVLRIVRMSDEEVRGWLLQLFTLIQSHKQYLLDEEGFVIHPDYVWVSRESDIHEVFLLYVPLRSDRRGLSHWRQWSELYDALIRSGVSKTGLSNLEPGRWSPESFSYRQLIEELYTPAASGKADGNIAGKQRIESEGSKISGKDLDVLVTDDGETMRFDTPKWFDSRRLWIVFGAVCMLAFLATWEWFWLGCSMLSLLPLFVKASRVWRALPVKGRAPEMSSETTANPQAQAEADAADERWEPLDMPIEERTTLLTAGADETMLLSHGGNGSVQKEVWLEVRAAGQTEGTTFPVAENSLLIGRGPTGVHLVMEQPGISRVHLEIRKHGEEYAALDIGSKNGTFYNDEPMIAFRPYMLKQGDSLRLPGAQLLFHQT